MKTTDQISMLVANIRTLFSTQGNYDGLGNGQAVKFGIVPNDMYDSKSATSANLTSTFKITNAFGGDVFITPATLSADGDKGAFIIEYNKLSTEACVTIVTGDWGSGQGSGLVGITAYDNDSASWADAGGDDLPDLKVGEGSTDVATPGAHGTGDNVSTPVPVAKAI